MNNLYTKQCPSCRKVFGTDDENAKVCPSCLSSRDYIKGGERRCRKKRNKRPAISIQEVMHIGAICDKVNGTSLLNHYGDIVQRIENTNVDRCVCCGEIVPEGRMICPKCEKAGG